MMSIQAFIITLGYTVDILLF